jgi:hypothetical protein
MLMDAYRLINTHHHKSHVVWLCILAISPAGTLKAHRKDEDAEEGKLGLSSIQEALLEIAYASESHA